VPVGVGQSVDRGRLGEVRAGLRLCSGVGRAGPGRLRAVAGASVRRRLGRFAAPTRRFPMDLLIAVTSEEWGEVSGGLSTSVPLPSPVPGAHPTPSASSPETQPRHRGCGCVSPGTAWRLLHGCAEFHADYRFGMPAGQAEKSRKGVSISVRVNILPARARRSNRVAREDRRNIGERK
jgi:hypothetical protein